MIYDRFDRLREGKTTLFVSHRLSCATKAGKIVVLSDGKVAEEGTHLQLMAEGGIYAKLYATQSSRYAP